MRCRTLLLLSASVLSAQTGRPRIAIGGISHESDSFNPAKTGLADFNRRPTAPRETVLEEWLKASDTVSGYVEGARRFDLDLYPLLVAGAQPKGPVTDQAFNTLLGDLIRQLQAGPKYDGLLAPLHGAMVVESYPHGDAELVRRLREAMGADFPIVVTHDFHANVTPEIVKWSTALITYKENPHIDPRERGVQAAEIMARTVRGQVKPVQVVVKPPMLYNIVFQYTKRPPLLPIVEESRRLEKNPKILAVSVSGGYQYADVPQIGPSVVVVTDNDRPLAQREAQRLSDMLWATRDKLVLKLPEAAAAVKQAMAGDKFPVALIDMGDNIGGGSSGDGTFLLEELIKQRATGWVVVIADREAVAAAVGAGIGGAFDMPVGGKTDQFHGKPVRVRGKVKSLHDGQYIETEVRHGGARYYNMGLTAVIEAEGSTRDLANLLLVTTQRSSPNSLHQLISNGVYPQRQKILTVKGAIAPRAAYEPIAARIIEVDTPGLTAVNPARFTYKLARRPLFGLDQ
ncbi:MAG: M81 family metallopeptidase [Acidobacteria bacterium]|nr:M81 family metallopeptidase [Acidobacteriota bacterium]